jgi:hypothetical protein
MRSGPDLLADCRECVIAYGPENGSREFVFIPAGTSHQMSPASGMRLPMRRCHTELSHYVFGVGRGGRCRESFRSFSQAAWETTSTLIEPKGDTQRHVPGLQAPATKNGDDQWRPCGSNASRSLSERTLKASTVRKTAAAGPSKSSD